MNHLRERMYVCLMNLAALTAPKATREIHGKVIELGMAAYHEELDTRIHRGFEGAAS